MRSVTIGSQLTRAGRRLAPIAIVLVVVSIAGVLVGSAFQAEKARVIPGPAVDQTASQATSEVAVLAAGCFWGVQGVYQHVKGVTNALSGYAGGQKRDADYERVSVGDTGHAESVQVTYDPRQISYGRILQIFFSVAHDPTQLNRQGPDHGTQYRSAIFTSGDEQKRVAQAYVAQLDRAKVYPQPIVTEIVALPGFYPAEAYHQNYLALHPTQPYIVFNDLPKLANLKTQFPDLYTGK
jgi:peptide-methionine (S)-S-oxide reductase